MTDHELIAHIHKRLNKQDDLLLELRDAVPRHMDRRGNAQACHRAQRRHEYRAGDGGHMMSAHIVDLARHKRSLGMIATSKSWRRFWLAWRIRRYPQAPD